MSCLDGLSVPAGTEEVSRLGQERDEVAKCATDSAAGLRTMPAVTKRHETIEERLERFSPHRLSARSWASARDDAVSAVLAASPSDETSAVCLISRLCAFLAAHQSWAGEDAPDLAVLLIPASIDAFVAERLRRGERRGTVGLYRSDLRRIARAIGTMAPVAPSGGTRTCAPGVAFWRVVVDEGPFTALVAAYERAARRMRPVTPSRWAQVEATTRLLIGAFGPPSRTWLSSQAGYLARFCVWVASRPERDDRDAELGPEEVLERSLVERFLAGAMADRPGASRSTARSVLRRAVQNLSAAPKPERIAHAPVQPSAPVPLGALLGAAGLRSARTLAD